MDFQWFFIQMQLNGILLVESEFVNGFNECLITVVNGKEIRMRVKFWNMNLLPGNFVSYGAVVQRDTTDMYLDVKVFSIIPFDNEFEAVLPCYLTAHGTLTGDLVKCEVWQSSAKENAVFTVQVVFPAKTPTPGSMLYASGSVMDFNGEIFKIKVFLRDFCPRPQVDSTKTQQSTPKRKIACLVIE